MVRNSWFDFHQYVVIVSTLVLTLLCCSGCSNSASATVSGTIEFEGTPLQAGVVIFESGNHTCTGGIRDGKYKLLCKGDSNIPIDQYEVTVFPPQPQMKTNPKTLELESVSEVDESSYPRKYRSRKTSGLKFTPKQGENEFAIKLSS